MGKSEDPTGGGSICTKDDPARSGVLSEADGSSVLILASCLHTGQNVLHDVSQTSTQVA